MLRTEAAALKAQAILLSAPVQRFLLDTPPVLRGGNGARLHNLESKAALHGCLQAATRGATRK